MKLLCVLLQVDMAIQAIQGDYKNTLLISPDAVISLTIGQAMPVLRHLEGTVTVQNSGLDWILFFWNIKFGPTHVFHLCISPCMPSFRCLEWLQRMAADGEVGLGPKILDIPGSPAATNYAAPVLAPQPSM